jgi:glycosyltransferase involved in cell wall biosynthesis
MTSTTAKQLKIGIFLFKYHPQLFGGIDTAFVRSIQAIVQYAPHHQYIVLANEYSLLDLQDKFKAIEDILSYHVLCSHPEPFERVIYAIKRYVLRQRRTYFLQQIDALDLDIIYYPHQRVFHRPTKAKVLLTLYDIQHEYYPEFFSEDVLTTRSKDYEKALRLADIVTTAADFTRATVAEKFPQFVHKTTRVYPGFETDWDKLDLHEVEAQLAPFDLPQQFIFYPANPWWHKNHGRLLAALRQLRNQGLTIPLVCTGRLKGQAPTRLQQLCLAAGMTESVYDLGFVEERTLQALYQRAEMLVFPSLFEGFGYPILEAQSNNCPIVCSNTTTLPEVAGDGAYFFDPNNADSIAHAILRVWEDHSLRQSLCEKGKNNLERFSWVTYAKEMMKLIDRV